MKPNAAWGVDLTSVSLRGAKLDQSPGGAARLIAWDVVDYTEEVSDPHNLARLPVMDRGVTHFRSRHKLRASRCWVSLRSESAFNRTVVVPPVSDESLDKLLDYEAQQQIPFPLEDVFWDRRVLEIAGSGEVRVSLYAIRRSLVEDRLTKIARMGLPVDGLQIRALALQNFCAFEGYLEPGTVVVEVDYGAISILIHDGLETWFMTLPLGGVDYVNRLKAQLGLDHREAVRVAASEAAPGEPGEWTRCREEAVRELTEEVASRVRFWFGTRPELRASNVVLFHSHRCVPRLQTALKRALGLPVFLPRGFRRLEVDPGVVTAGIQEHFAGLAKAVGLALQGIGKAEVDAKLFPRTIERNLGTRRSGWVAAALLLLAIFAAGSWRANDGAEGLAGTRTTETEVMASAVPRERALEETALEPLLEEFREIETPLSGLDGPLPLIDHLYDRLGAWPSAIHLAAFEWSPGREAAPRIVLAVPVGQGGEEAANAALNDFAESLRAGAGVTGVREGREWNAGQPMSDPPSEVIEGRLLRRVYRHGEYTLEITGGSER